MNNPERIGKAREAASYLRNEAQACDQLDAEALIAEADLFDSLADALEACERKDVERVHENNKLRLMMQKLEQRAGREKAR